MSQQFTVHQFHDLATSGFDVKDYSELKFGGDQAAKKLGYQLANKFYVENKTLLVNNRCVVIPSAYNVVEIAATIMARHFMNRLNDLLTREDHPAVEWTTMHRSMSYIQDYSYLPKNQRQELLAGDKLYINKDFIQNKILLFVDDVTITGTHEDKIQAFLESEGLTNQKIFLYYAKYMGHSADIEAKLNLSGIQDIYDYVNLVKKPNHHLVVRAVRFLLDSPIKDLTQALGMLDRPFIDKLYHACLSKEYNKIESYQQGFDLIRQRYDYYERG